MKDGELIAILSDMYNNAAPHREQMIALILFGTMYADEIRSMSCTRRELYSRAGVPSGNVEIGYGMRLSQYVKLEHDPRWL